MQRRACILSGQLMNCYRLDTPVSDQHAHQEGALPARVPPGLAYLGSGCQFVNFVHVVSRVQLSDVTRLHAAGVVISSCIVFRHAVWHPWKVRAVYSLRLSLPGTSGHTGNAGAGGSVWHSCCCVSGGGIAVISGLRRCPLDSGGEETKGVTQTRRGRAAGWVGP